ncbi:MAG: dienelactone hydrolase family protein [Rhodoferax sp.]|nr:dienelactone hydrolase family protein [Rhodoferax sp.]
MAHYIELTAADGFAFPAYEARPAGQAKGAVVVLQEIFGVNAHIRAVVEGFAAEGFLAVAPAMFHRVKPGVELGYTPEDVAAGVALKAAAEGLPSPGVMPDIQAAIRYAAQANGAAKVGLVGYCWGGLLAWRGACLLSGVSAAVPYYGGGMTSAAELACTPHCPVLAHFGDHDQSIPLAGVAAFKHAHPDVQVHLYPASHGFNCDHRSAFDATAAALARERTLAFLARHLA